MPGKARPGKQKVHRGAKKRTTVTSKGKVRMMKAAHNHRLDPKNDRQLNLGGRMMVVAGKASRTLKTMLSS